MRHNKMLLEDYLGQYKCGEEYFKIESILKKERSKNSPWSIEFYTSRGKSVNEAKKEIEIKRKNRKKPKTSPSRVEHWINKGLSLTEAEQRVKKYKQDIGKLPTLENLILKFGEDEGQRKWKQYQDKIKNRQQTFLENASESILESKLIRWFNNSKTKKGNIVREFDFDNFRDYCDAVKTATKITVAVYGDEIDPGRNKLGIIYGKNGYDLDHKFSKYGGFYHKIHPLLIGCKENLRLIPYKENVEKGQFCTITLEELKSYKTILEDVNLSTELRNKINEIFINKKKN